MQRMELLLGWGAALAWVGTAIPQLHAQDHAAAMPQMDMPGMGKHGMKTDMKMAGMNMPGGAMPSSIDLTDAMNRESSGTSWNPDSTPMYGKMMMRGKDMLMLHGAIWPRYTTVGSGRDISIAGHGSSSKFDAPSWFMGMYSHPLGVGMKPPAQVGVRLMMSADPLIERSYGYPLLYQSGETYKGLPLHDRQHPHDLFDELSVTYSRRLGAHDSTYLYVGYPGEPALGPPTFMHRLSAMDNPDAPISHHWQDSTHITFGVTTLGFSTGKVKLEASAFKGREPDENRYNFESPKLDSSSARLSWSPTRNLALQVSHGFIKSPEALAPTENRHRTTASVIYNRPLGADANWSNALVWGQNNDSGTGKSNSYLIETDYQKQANTLYARVERVQKPGQELVLAPPLDTGLFNVGSYSVGYVRDLKHGKGLDFGVGAQATLFTNPTSLNTVYGASRHGGFEVFLRIRPSRMDHGMAMSSMAGMDGDGGTSPTSPISADSGNAVNVAATIAPNPPTAGGHQVVTLILTDAAGKPITGVAIHAAVAMTTMDMGTAHPVFKELGNGRYSGTVAFAMAGPWRLTLTITPRHGPAVTKHLDYSVQP